MTGRTDSEAGLLAGEEPMGRDPDRAGQADALDAIAETIFVVRLGESRYGFPATAIAEIDRFVEPVAVPGAPPHILGLAQVRGRIYTVVALDHLLSIQRLPTENRPRLVVIDDATDEPFAVVVDEAFGLHEVPENAFRPCEAPSATRVVCREFDGPDGCVSIVDPPRLRTAIGTGRGT